MPKPTPCHVVTTTIETMAAVASDCQSTWGRPTEVASWFRMPRMGSNSRRKMTPAATPDTTTGR